MSWLLTARSVVANRTAAFVTPAGLRIDPAPPEAFVGEDDGMPPEAAPDGVWLDMQSANALLVVYDALSPSRRAEFEKMPVLVAVARAWRVLEIVKAKAAR